MSGVWLRPLGLLYGSPATSAIKDKIGLPLAGGPIAFVAAELIEGGAAKATRRVVSIVQLAQSREAALTECLTRVTAARKPFAGLGFERPLLMGVVNVTPDSFSDGGLYDCTEDAVRHAAELATAGADILDIGGESTRPGSDAVAENEELGRVVPVIEALSGSSAVLSIDTRKARVAASAARGGAQILNDVSALSYDPASAGVAAKGGLSVILMHAKGEPKTMQDNPTYEDVVLEVYAFLKSRIEAAMAAGVSLERIAVDPGIGFGKTVAHNLQLLASLSLFHGLGVPILVGASRKGFIASLSQGKDPQNREPGSHAVAILAASQGVQMLRVHDVAGARQALNLWQAAANGAGPAG